MPYPTASCSEPSAIPVTGPYRLRAGAILSFKSALHAEPRARQWRPSTRSSHQRSFRGIEQSVRTGRLRRSVQLGAVIIFSDCYPKAKKALNPTLTGAGLQCLRPSSTLKPSRSRPRNGFPSRLALLRSSSPFRYPCKCRVASPRTRTGCLPASGIRWAISGHTPPVPGRYPRRAPCGTARH